MSLNITRHQRVFNPQLHEVPVILAGCGATGSHIAMQLVALGCTKLHVVDPDEVESHNIPNQVFQHSDIGAFKVDAFFDNAVRKVGDPRLLRGIQIHYGRLPEMFSRMDMQFARTNQAAATPPGFVGQTNGRAPVLILAVDSMRARKEIVDYLHYHNSVCECHIIDTRMASSYGNVFSFDLRTQYDAWCATLIRDEDAAESACGEAVSIIPTVQFTASLAVWEYIKYCTNPVAMSEVTNFFLKPTTLHTEDLSDVEAQQTAA